MNAHDVDTGWLHQESLDGVSEILIECDQVDFAVEADDTLTSVVQLIVQPAQDAPEFKRAGSELRIKQNGRYRGRVTPLIRLPAVDCPDISAKLGKGDLSFQNVPARVVVKLGMGDVDVQNGSGDALVSLGKGDIAIAGRDRRVAIKLGMGDVSVSRCPGGVSVSLGKGDVSVSQCGAGIALKNGSGDISIDRPSGGPITVTTGSGDISVDGGEAHSLMVRTGKGDIDSTARLLVEPTDIPDEPEPEPDEDDFSFEDIEDIDEVSFSLGDIEFEASDEGVRIGRGRRDLLKMGPDGIQISRGGREISLGPDGIRVGEPKSGPSGAGRFSLETSKGDISIALPNDLSLRVEVLATGDVQSEVPLVSVGRPGPRGTVKRLVGVLDGAGSGPRVSVQLRTKRGDVALRTVRVQPRAQAVTKAPDAERDRDEQARVILEALARGDLSVGEAERLLAALDR